MLVQYEYKKIFQSRFTTILLTIAIVLSIMTPLLNAYGGYSYSHEEGNLSKSQALKMDKDIMNENKGYLTEEVLKEVVLLTQGVLDDKDNFFYNNGGKEVLKPNVRKEFILPYLYIYNFLNYLYEGEFDEIGIKKPIQYLDAEEMNGFYEDYKKLLEENISGYANMAPIEKQRHLDFIQQIETPFYNEYAEGWLSVRNMLPGIGLLILLTIIIAIGNVFNKEYDSGMDALILSSKQGKSQVIWAKFVTVISFSGAISGLMFLLHLGIYLVVLGFDGYNLPIQLMAGFEYCTYPISIGEFIFISFGVFLAVSVSFGCFCAFISANFKNTTAGINVLFLVAILPMFIPQMDNRILSQLSDLLFVRALNHHAIFSEYLYTFGSITFTPYVFYIIASIIGSTIFLPLAYKGFKNHQVS